MTHVGYSRDLDAAEVFHGGRMVGVAFLTQMVSMGFAFYCFGVFFKELARTFDASRFSVALAIACMNLVGAANAPFVGRFVDAKGAKRTLVLGTVILGCGLLVMASVTSIWQFSVVFGVTMGLANHMMGNTTTSSLLARWYVARRATALGYASTGVSVAGIALPALDVAMTAHFGWRAALIAHAAFVFFVVLPCVLLFAVDSPTDVGQHPDGTPSAQPAGAAVASSDPAMDARAVWRQPLFYALAGTMGLSFFATNAVLAHLVPLLSDAGFGAAGAATLLSVVAGASLVGKPWFGHFSDRFGPRAAMSLSLGLQGLGVLGLIFSASSSGLLLASVLSFGLGTGGTIPLMGALLASAFGAARLGATLGLLTLTTLPLFATGVPFAGWVHDTTGSYLVALEAFVVAYLGSIGLLAAASASTSRASVLQAIDSRDAVPGPIPACDTRFPPV